MKGLGCLVLLLCEAAAAQTSPFSNRLYPILKDAGCPNCHNSNGVASATRLHFPESSASTQRVEAFGRSLVRLVDRDHPEESLLLKKPTRRIPHAGGERIKPGSPEESALIDWIRFLSAMPADELAAALKYDEAGPESERRRGAVLRRLTNSQYNNTVRDLLGDQTQPADQFPPEDFVEWLQRSVRLTKPLTAARRSLRYGCGETGAKCISKRRPAPSHFLQGRCVLSRSTRKRVRPEGLPPAPE